MAMFNCYVSSPEGIHHEMSSEIIMLKATSPYLSRQNCGDLSIYLSHQSDEMRYFIYSILIVENLSHI